MGGPCRPDFPKSTITAGPRTTHYDGMRHEAAREQRVQPGKGEGRRGK